MTQATSREQRYVVRSFGQDCWGNVTGYLVRDTTDGSCVAHEVADIYKEGSHPRAKRRMQKLAANMNAEDRQERMGGEL